MEWIEPQFGQEDHWLAQPHPLLTYHKVPYLMAARGRQEECRRSLTWIKANLMTPEGDFHGAPAEDGKAAQAAFVREKCWVAMAAQISGRYDISMPAAHYLASCQGGSTGGVYNVDATGAREEAADVRATASAGAVFVATGCLCQARLAGRFLARAIQLQSEQHRFFVRMDDLGRTVNKVPRAHAAADTVVKPTRGAQLSYLAMPIIFLVRLQMATGETEWLEAAMDYYAFTDQFREEALHGDDSAAMAWAAGMLYGATRRRVYYDAAEKVCERWLDCQKNDGSWRKSKDTAAAIALTSQTAVSLFEALREAQ